MIRRTFLAAACLALTAVPSLAQDLNVIDTARAQGDAKVFVQLADDSGLSKALEDPGPFTLFVPTDTAFHALPTGTVESLTQPQNRDRLLQVLGFHVVNGTVITAADIAGAGDPKIPAVKGDDVAVVSNGILVNGSQIVRGDIAASNGIVHMIDTVILPPVQ